MGGKFPTSLKVIKQLQSHHAPLHMTWILSEIATPVHVIENAIWISQLCTMFLSETNSAGVAGSFTNWCLFNLISAPRRHSSNSYWWVNGQHNNLFGDYHGIMTVGLASDGASFLWPLNLLRNGRSLPYATIQLKMATSENGNIWRTVGSSIILGRVQDVQGNTMGFLD